MRTPKDEYERRKAQKEAQKKLEREFYKSQQSAEERQKLEQSTRKPEDVQKDLAGAYFSAGQMQFGIKSLENRLMKQNSAIYKFEEEMEKAIEVWGYPEEPTETKEFENVQAQ